MQDTSGVHVWLVLAKAFHALAAYAQERINDREPQRTSPMCRRVLLNCFRLRPLPGGRGSVTICKW
jgi:hypothetical protein